MKWTTRPGVHVDRAASAWLIQRFVDTEAEFLFLDDPDDIPVNATGFDMIRVELTHHGDDVTFETILNATISTTRSSVSWDRSSTRPTSPTTSTTLRKPPDSMPSSAGSPSPAPTPTSSPSPTRSSTVSTPGYNADTKRESTGHAVALPPAGQRATDHPPSEGRGEPHGDHHRLLPPGPQTIGVGLGAVGSQVPVGSVGSTPPAPGRSRLSVPSCEALSVFVQPRLGGSGLTRHGDRPATRRRLAPQRSLGAGRGDDDAGWPFIIDAETPGIGLPAACRGDNPWAQACSVGNDGGSATTLDVGASATPAAPFGGVTGSVSPTTASTPPSSSTTAGATIPQPVMIDDLPVAPGAQRIDLAMPAFSDPTDVTDPLHPLAWVESVLLLGTVDNQAFRTEVTLLPDTIIVVGRASTSRRWSPSCRVPRRPDPGGRLDFYAQADDGSVFYFGEDVFDFADGAIVDTQGTWIAGKDGPGAMIMPADPQIGEYRPENIPGFVFEEVTVTDVDRQVEGPFGPDEGAIIVAELHMDGSLEDKTFAPGYGEFYTSGGGDTEALALAVPTDAATGGAPTELNELLSGATTVLEAVKPQSRPAPGRRRRDRGRLGAVRPRSGPGIDRTGDKQRRR